MIVLQDQREMALWNAAYAAAWVSDFRVSRRAGQSFDDALVDDHATYAIRIADAAVRQFRDRPGA